MSQKAEAIAVHPTTRAVGEAKRAAFVAVQMEDAVGAAEEATVALMGVVAVVGEDTSLAAGVKRIALDSDGRGVVLQQNLDENSAGLAGSFADALVALEELLIAEAVGYGKVESAFGAADFDHLKK